MKKKIFVFWTMLAALAIVCLPVLCQAERPVINNVEIFNYRDLTNPTLELVMFDEVLIIVYGTDTDLDCTWLKISQYLLDDSDAIPVYEDWLYMGIQEMVSDTFEFDSDIIGPPGDWRIDFQAEDEAENLSEIYSVFVTVYAVAPKPKSKSGSSGGGGGCFISTMGNK